MIMGKEEREWLWKKEEENDYGERRRRMIMGKGRRRMIMGKRENNDDGEKYYYGKWRMTKRKGERKKEIQLKGKIRGLKFVGKSWR